MYILPLLLTLILISVFKHTMGNEFPYNYMIPKSIFFIFIVLSSYLIIHNKHYAFAISILSVALLSSSIWMMFDAKTILGGIGGEPAAEEPAVDASQYQVPAFLAAPAAPVAAAPAPVAAEDALGGLDSSLISKLLGTSLVQLDSDVKTDKQ